MFDFLLCAPDMGELVLNVKHFCQRVSDLFYFACLFEADRLCGLVARVSGS
jgi:hypothetical protein